MHSVDRFTECASARTFKRSILNGSVTCDTGSFKKIWTTEKSRRSESFPIPRREDRCSQDVGPPPDLGTSVSLYPFCILYKTASHHACRLIACLLIHLLLLAFPQTSESSSTAWFWTRTSNSSHGCTVLYLPSLTWAWRLFRFFNV